MVGYFLRSRRRLGLLLITSVCDCRDGRKFELNPTPAPHPPDHIFSLNDDMASNFLPPIFEVPKWGGMLLAMSLTQVFFTQLMHKEVFLKFVQGSLNSLTRYEDEKMRF